MTLYRIYNKDFSTETSDLLVLIDEMERYRLHGSFNVKIYRYVLVRDYTATGYTTRKQVYYTECFNGYEVDKIEKAIVHDLFIDYKKLRETFKESKYND